jgi:hypothetical protein
MSTEIVSEITDEISKLRQARAIFRGYSAPAAKTSAKRTMSGR